LARVRQHRYEEAIEWVDRSFQENPNNHAAIRGRVALSGYLGHAEEACEWVARLLEVNPLNTIAWFKAFGSRFLSPGTLAVWVEGLRRAGLPRNRPWPQSFSPIARSSTALGTNAARTIMY
jgi:tetratricopeptide (TPR) repeat protein